MPDVNRCPEELVAPALKGPLWSYAYVPKFLHCCYIRLLCTDIPGTLYPSMLKAELWGQVERATVHSSKAARYGGFVMKNLTEEFASELKPIETFLLLFERTFNSIMKTITHKVTRGSITRKYLINM